MGNLTITNADLGSVVFDSAKFEDDTFNAAATGTVVEGTILARTSADSKLVLFDKSGTGGAEIPVAVLGADVEVAAIGDVSVRPIISGRVRTGRLVIAAGVDTTVDKIVTDQLRDYSIVALSVEELNTLDNQ